MRSKSSEIPRKIIDAGHRITLEKGYKAMTMEGVAAVANIAKGTLYSYFPDKDAVFTALINDFAETKSEAFARAFTAEGTLVERIAGGLSEKYGVVADFLEGSAHAFELLGEHTRLSAQFKNADIAIDEMIIAEMQGAGIEDAEDILPVINAACSGILATYPNGKAVRAAVTLLCQRMLR